MALLRGVQVIHSPQSLRSFYESWLRRLACSRYGNFADAVRREADKIRINGLCDPIGCGSMAGSLREIGLVSSDIPLFYHAKNLSLCAGLSD